MITTGHTTDLEVHLLSQIDATISLAPIAEQEALPAIVEQAQQVATLFIDFVAAAQQSLDICIYDFRLVVDSVQDAVVAAINDAAARGVAVRIAYDKNEQDDLEILKKFLGAGGDPAPVGTSAFLTSAALHPAVEVVPVAETAIDPGRQIMHNKYLIRDGTTVWTGSANFTVDAWALQENTIVVLGPSPELAAGYQQDFDALWATQRISGTGAGDSATVTVGATPVTYAFAPGGGAVVEALIADHISAATTRVRIASMVMSSQVILAAIDERIRAGVDVAGIYDYPETNQVREAWRDIPADADKLALLEAVIAKLVPKYSLPFISEHTDWAHNFLHTKIAVADDTVLTGSFNFSNNATHNAENVVALTDPDLADHYAAWIDTLAARYATPPDESRS